MGWSWQLQGRRKEETEKKKKKGKERENKVWHGEQANLFVKLLFHPFTASVLPRKEFLLGARLCLLLCLILV
jgi:hypothetical protein